MRWFYSIILYLLSPYLLVRLWWKGRRLPAYRERIKERFALTNPGEIKHYDVWLHAVSLGEVIAVTPLVEKLLQSQRKILLTTMTPTGSAQVQKQFSNRIDHCYLPYELPCVMRQFFKQNRPRLGIIVETELWPNMIHYAKNSGVNLLLVNARLSQKSYQGYKKLKWFFKPLLQHFTGIYTQSEEDAQRFRQLGADQEKVTYVGNIKYDLQFTESKSVADFPAANWGKDRIIVLLASTHHNEEEQVLKLLKVLQASIPDVLLLIAPRHPERFQEIINLSRNMGYCTGQRSQSSSISPDNQVVVIDSLGELLFFYQLGHIAFVGGSLVPVGGHNVLEAVAMQVPVISGRQVQNFKAIIADLEKKQAIVLVNDATGLIETIIALYQDEQRRSNLVRNASEVLASNRGSITKYVAVIDSALGN